jgi:hypothetical protein
MEQAIKLLQNNIKQKDEQLVAIDIKRAKISAERGEMITTLKGLQKMTTNENQSLTTKNEILKEENWDLLGQPSGKYDYYVKYTTLESSKIPIETIVPSGWNIEQEAESSETTLDSKKSWADKVEEEDEAKKMVR